MKLGFKTKLLLACFLPVISYLFLFHIEFFCQFQKNKLGCFDNNIRLRFSFFGLDNSIDFLEKLVKKNYITEGECHTLGHYLGRASAKANVSIIEAMEGKKSFCGWAYFHGLMEGLFNKNADHGSLSQEAYKTCQTIPQGKTIDVFNCFHSLGHGLYSVDYDLLNSLKRCDPISELQNKGFCHDGVFMANTFIGWGVENKYLKSDDPIFPCQTISDEYKVYCYWRNISINVFNTNSKIPEVDDKFKNILWNGLGREYDGRIDSNYEEIIKFCSSSTPENNLECLLGAGRHMIFYDKGGTTRAEKLCEMSQQKESCLSRMNTPDLGP